MPFELLPTSNYPAVRAAIDVSLGTAALPDAIIELDIYARTAARDVLAVDPNALSLTDLTQQAHAQAAAVYFCAARLITALPQITRESGLGFTRERTLTSPAERAAELRALASAELDAYLASSPAIADLPTVFTTAHGQRGRW